MNNTKSAKINKTDILRVPKAGTNSSVFFFEYICGACKKTFVIDDKEISYCPFCGHVNNV